MIYESNFLAHYGINGQKWGIRRFQNPDGTYTAAGKIRYAAPADKEELHQRYKRTEDALYKKLTNKYTKFEKKPVDIEEVKRRGGLNTADAKKCISIANEMFLKASRAEPQITEDVVHAVSSTGNKMYWLENRLKQPTSIAAKVGSVVKERNMSFDDAAKTLKDVIRYSAVSEPNELVNSYYQIRETLGKEGYQEVRCRNFFDMYSKGLSQHKAVHSVFSDLDGNVFELQFHTPASLAVKEVKTPIYEERRRAGLSEERKKDLERQMHDLADFIEEPINIMQIETHG